MKLDSFLYLIIAVSAGYAAIKMKLLPEEVIVTFPSLLTNICYPAMIISSLISLSIKDLISDGLTISIITLAVTFILYLTGRIIFRRLERPKRLLFNFILGVGNVTYVGIPIISIFFGSKGVYYAVIHGVIQDIMIWFLYFPSYLTGDKKNKGPKIINPCTAALVIGLLLALTRLKLPGFIIYTLNNLKSVTSPVALLFLGAIIAKYGMFGWVKNKSAIISSTVKVVMVPLLLFGVLSIFTNRYTALIMSILFACPAPIMAIVWAKQYDGDVELAINCCIFSTLLYLIVMSISLSVFTLVGWI